MSSEENNNDKQEPESLFPGVDIPTTDNNPSPKSEEKQEEATPQAASLLPPPSYEYVIDGQQTGDMLYDPWATVSVPSTPSAGAAPGAATPSASSSMMGRFTRSRIAAFAAVVVAVAFVFGSAAYALTRPASQATASMPTMTTLPHPPHAAATAPMVRPTSAPTAAPTAAVARAARTPITAPQAVQSTPSSPNDNVTTQQDTFNRVNHAGSWGPQWQVSSTEGDTQAFSVQPGNVAEIQASNTIDSSFYTAIFNNSSASTQDATITFNLQHYSQQQKNAGIVLRWQDPNNYYKAYINGQFLVILRSIGGQKTLLRFVQFTASDDVLYSLRFRVAGNHQLMAKVWPTTSGSEPTSWMVSVNDNTFSSGQAGVRAMLTGGDVVQVTRFSVSTGG
jgi:hypothetical protein